ncbi:MAG: L-histidine N(alpha)-methyltransferase [Bacteroidales bacterium]|nr:L-histidine N(alpha)-methyltransferase [Bacteroidales bacterium]MDT8374256.1 L-histidine N(alpha)-methyltransferase [Bacteroidales bacterium]
MQKKIEYYITGMTDIQSLEVDTLKGLSSAPKYLLSKYFYDDAGSSIFQEITKLPEYYLTRSEQEILENQKDQITDAIISNNSRFDLLELGSGDGVKTKILLKQLVQKRSDFKYIPVDISSKANSDLVSDLHEELPSLEISPLTGDFFGLKNSGNFSGDTRKVILFLGSNIGNFTEPEIDLFFTQLYDLCRKGDKVLIGFDLKKSPDIIMNAYDDPSGLTRKFNLNHLARLNRELEADFNLSKFEHHTTYNPVSGYLKSYLISGETQTVTIKSLGHRFVFNRWEPIFMELSRKFDLPSIERIASAHGFSIEKHFTDQKNWFTDSLWVRT